MLQLQRRGAQTLFSGNADANSHVTATRSSHADSDAGYQRESGRNSANTDADRESQVHWHSRSGSLADSDAHAEERGTWTQHADADSTHQDS